MVEVAHGVITQIDTKEVTGGFFAEFSLAGRLGVFEAGRFLTVTVSGKEVVAVESGTGSQGLDDFFVSSRPPFSAWIWRNSCPVFASLKQRSVPRAARFKSLRT